MYLEHDVVKGPPYKKTKYECGSCEFSTTFTDNLKIHKEEFKHDHQRDFAASIADNLENHNKSKHDESKLN